MKRNNWNFNDGGEDGAVKQEPQAENAAPPVTAEGSAPTTDTPTDGKPAEEKAE